MYLFLQSGCIYYVNTVREISENLVLRMDNFPMTPNGTYHILADTQRCLDEN